MKPPSTRPRPADFAGATPRQPSLPRANSNTATSAAGFEPVRHSLFQIAAQMEIPGLPRITIRRLRPNQSVQSGSAQSKPGGNKLADDFNSSRLDPYKPEHEIWAAALSRALQPYPDPGC